MTPLGWRAYCLHVLPALTKELLMKIVPINASTLPVYRSELAALLLDAVKGGASIGYTEDITPEEAANYFHGLRPALAKGDLLLWIARDESGVTGCVQLELCQKPNGRN